MIHRCFREIWAVATRYQNILHQGTAIRVIASGGYSRMPDKVPALTFNRDIRAMEEASEEALAQFVLWIQRQNCGGRREFLGTGIDQSQSHICFE